MFSFQLFIYELVNIYFSNIEYVKSALCKPIRRKNNSCLLDLLFRLHTLQVTVCWGLLSNIEYVKWAKKIADVIRTHHLLARRLYHLVHTIFIKGCVFTAKKKIDDGISSAPIISVLLLYPIYFLDRFLYHGVRSCFIV